MPVLDKLVNTSKTIPVRIEENSAVADDVDADADQVVSER